jgi:hypothetical protein
MRAYLGVSRLDARRIARLFVLACLGLLLFVLVVPGCGRSSLEPETLDGGATSSCSPSTCPNGCCDATGVCRTGRDVRACGSVGGRCSDCVANGFNVCTSARVCGRDEPSCSSRTCLGCCSLDDGRLRCLSGTEPAACGRGGEACTDCSEQGRACDGSSRSCGSTTCDASNCDGCCVGDKCLPGTTTSACGAKGARCDACGAGQHCSAVGGGGGRCEGTTACGPDNCGGCCNAAGQCVTGTDTTACGANGAKCDSCGLNEVCAPNGTCQAQPTCGPSNCPGCCVGNQCVISTTPIACGTKGQVCKTCGPNEICDPTGKCVSGSVCNPATCGGCCVGDICAVGTQQTACGTNGTACLNCANQGRVCQSGSCQVPACGPATCPNGCCSGNTCVLGTQDNACGKAGGAACTDCTASNQTCQNQQCVQKCGPSNCAGCCRPDGTCDGLGSNNNSCGQGGVACDNCSATGSFCNGLVVPRRCNDDQSTCPAPYNSCAPGITMPATPQLQNVCTDANLDTLALACAGGADTIACGIAVAALPAACRTCIAPFNHPFEQNTGLFACAASSVSTSCRRAMGCSDDCAQTSCSQCLATSENSCITLVTNPGGQCRTLFNTSCANAALSSGLCSRFSYASYGAWLRGVGDQFCGNGP